MLQDEEVALQAWKWTHKRAPTAPFRPQHTQDDFAHYDHLLPAYEYSPLVMSPKTHTIVDLLSTSKCVYCCLFIPGHQSS